jgi:ABC-type dipeptide/oligopeptide/nickel transport system permease subunit
MSYRRRKLLFTAKRLGRFIRVFFRNKKGATGFFVIVGFCIVALIAPFLTPYDSMGYDPNRKYLPVAPILQPPAWLRYLPPWLGGNPNIAETISEVIKNPSSIRLVHDGGDLQCTGDLEFINMYYSDVDAPGSTGGSLAIKLFRKPEEKDNVTIHILKELPYPYNSPPARLQGTIFFMLNGTVKEDGKLEIPVNIMIFVGPTDGEKWKVFPPPGAEERLGVWGPLSWVKDYGLSNGPGTSVIADKPNFWIVTASLAKNLTYSYMIDSQSYYMMLICKEYGAKMPYGRVCQTIFSKTPGNYIFDLQITFINLRNASQNATTTLYIDEYGFILWGTGFGVLGTDHMGRDIFSQLIYGTRVSLYIGILAAALSVLIGLIVGIFSGYKGGIIDEAVMRINDFLLVIPFLPLLMVLIVVFRSTSLELLIMLLGILGWNGFARIVRSQVLSLKERPFIEATKAAGAGTAYIIFRHLIPNVMPLVYVTLATTVPGAVTLEASLSWLGFYDPSRMSWGRMLHDFTAQAAETKTYWWWVMPPGLCIALLATSFILLGYALDEILNPRLRVRR